MQQQNKRVSKIVDIGELDPAHHSNEKEIHRRKSKYWHVNVQGYTSGRCLGKSFCPARSRVLHGSYREIGKTTVIHHSIS